MTRNPCSWAAGTTAQPRFSETWTREPSTGTPSVLCRSRITTGLPSNPPLRTLIRKPFLPTIRSVTGGARNNDRLSLRPRTRNPIPCGRRSADHRSSPGAVPNFSTQLRDPGFVIDGSPLFVPRANTIVGSPCAIGARFQWSFLVPAIEHFRNPCGRREESRHSPPRGRTVVCP